LVGEPPLLEQEDAPLAIKARFKAAQLLPERLAGRCQFMTNFSESVFSPSFRGSRSGNFDRQPFVVMAGLVPAIHVLLAFLKQRRGCPAQGRA
jgi:hypothetical protein